jgi:hypothetical protein
VAIRIEHVELIRGEGWISSGGNIYSVGYVIDVYQKFNESIPLLKSTPGRLTAKPVELVSGELVHGILGTALDLELQYGRHARIFVKNLDGDFEVAGRIQTPYIRSDDGKRED